MPLRPISPSNSDPAKAAESIKRFSEKDAAKWPEFVAFMDKSALFLDSAYATIMPRLPKDLSLSEGYGLAEMALDLRLMGRTDMLNLIRLLPMTVVEFLEEWFESEQLKAAVASLAIHGVTLGVMSAGTGYTLLHNWLNRGGLAHANVGNLGELTAALANAVKAHGGEIRTGAEVAHIQVDTYTCKGVRLLSGEEISSGTVISAVDPKRTFLSLVGAVNLPPEFVWKVSSIKMRGSVAKLHLLTDGHHGLPDGTSVLAPSLKYLERAYDAAKYGQISEHPYLEVTTDGEVVSIHFQFAPYALRSSDWKTETGTVEKLALNALSEFFPDLQSSIIDRKLHYSSRPRNHLWPDRRRPQPRSAHARSVPIHAADPRLVQSQDAGRRPLSVWKRRARRRRRQRRKREECGQGVEMRLDGRIMISYLETRYCHCEGSISRVLSIEGATGSIAGRNLRMMQIYQVGHA